MLASIFTILSNPVLMGGLLICTVLGGTSLLTALHLCGIKGLIASCLKYILAAVSIEAISNSFMIVLNPDEFLITYQSLQSVKLVVSFILFWVLIYEANRIIQSPRVTEFFKKKPVSAQ